MSAPHQNTLLRAIPAVACLTLDDLEPLVGLPRKALKQALGKLVARRLIERIERGCYQLTAAGRQAAEAEIELSSASQTSLLRAARNTFRRRLWAAMRMSAGSFTVADITRLAVRDEVWAEVNAQHYCCALFRAGYLRRLPKRKSRNANRGVTPLRYALVRDTGPMPPVVSRAQGLLRDPNTGEVLPCRV